MKISDIVYDIEVHEVIDYVSELSAKNAAKALDIPYDRYVNMHRDEIVDYIHDRVKRDKCFAQEAMELPDEILLPDRYDWDNDEIIDFIECEYGWSVLSWRNKQ